MYTLNHGQNVFWYIIMIIKVYIDLSKLTTIRAHYSILLHQVLCISLHVQLTANLSVAMKQRIALKYNNKLLLDLQISVTSRGFWQETLTYLTLPDTID